MKTKNFYLCFLLLSLLACACRQGEEIKAGKEYVFKKAEGVKTSDVLKNYEIIPLETTDDNLIQWVSTVVITKQRIFVLDIGRNKVFAFSKDGKYIGAVGNIGEGPGEYVRAFCLMVHEPTNQVFIDDGMRRKLISYNMETLQFIQEYDQPFSADCTANLGNDKFVWFCGAGWRNDERFKQHIQITDLQCNPIASLVDKYEDFPKIGKYNSYSYFSTIQGTVYFHHPFLTDFYSCTEDLTVAPAFSIKWEGESFPTKQYVESHNQSIINSLERDGYMMWCDVFGNSRTLLSSGGGKDVSYLGVYNMKKDEGWYIDVKKIEDDMGIGTFPIPMTTFNDYFATCISMEQQFPDGSVMQQYVHTDGEPQNPALLLFKCN